MWCWLYYGRAVDKACVVNNVQEAWYPHMQLSADTAGARHAAELLFCIPCSTNYKHWGRDSTQQWNGTRRGIKNNKEMANCAPQPNLIRQQPPTDWVKAVYFDDCQFLPGTAQSWEHQSIFMIDFGVLFWLEECGPCVKCFYPRPEGLRSRDCDGISELTRIQLIL